MKRNEGDTVVDSMAYSVLLKLETPTVTDMSDLFGFDGTLDTEGVVRFEFLQLELRDGENVQCGALIDVSPAPIRLIFEKD